MGLSVQSCTIYHAFQGFYHDRSNWQTMYNMFCISFVVLSVFRDFTMVGLPGEYCCCITDNPMCLSKSTSLYMVSDLYLKTFKLLFFFIKYVVTPIYLNCKIFVPVY